MLEFLVFAGVAKAPQSSIRLGYIRSIRYVLLPHYHTAAVPLPIFSYLGDMLGVTCVLLWKEEGNRFAKR